MRAFIESGGRGLNVTVPFKLDAFRFAARHSTRASAAGAVNTLKVLDDGSVFGDNTDGVGLVNDLERNLDVPLAGKRVLLLGAGGAARGVVLPLVEAGVREIVIVNRTASKAVELAQAFASMPVEEGMSVIDAPTIRRRILGATRKSPWVRSTSSSMQRRAVSAAKCRRSIPRCSTPARWPTT